VFACARSLDGCIQSEQVSLVGNVVDYGNHLPDLLA